MEEFKRLMEEFDKIDEFLFNTNVNLYESILKDMSDEKLGYEFAEKIGDETGEFKSMMYHEGREKVIEYLMDNYKGGYNGRLAGR